MGSPKDVPVPWPSQSTANQTAGRNLLITDGSEIPRPTTVWMVHFTLVNHVVNYVSLKWFLAGFLNHQRQKSKPLDATWCVQSVGSTLIHNLVNIDVNSTNFICTNAMVLHSHFILQNYLSFMIPIQFQPHHKTQQQHLWIVGLPALGCIHLRWLHTHLLNHCLCRKASRRFCDVLLKTIGRQGWIILKCLPFRWSMCRSGHGMWDRKRIQDWSQKKRADK